MVNAVPAAVRRAGVIVGLEGVAALVVAVVVGFAGTDRKLAFGTAGWFVLVGGALLAAGWALWGGRRWGRGLAIFAQLLLLPVAWYMAVGSHRLALGVPVAVAALGTLLLLFSPSAVRWASGGDDR